MLVGHIACGFLVHYFTQPRNKPSWCSILGSTISDILAGIFILFGIEYVRGNPRFTPLGLDLVYIDITHSFLTTLIWAIIWSSFCHIVVKKKANIRMSSFLAVLSHWIADILVHKPDMPLYPNANTKYGLALWQSIPVQTWLGELMLILIVVGLMVDHYGFKKARFPLILLVSIHLLNYPGLPTNTTYALGKNFQNNPLLLRFSVGIAFIAANLVPALLVSKHLDTDDGHKRY
ncbi:unnamed protein product [Adineta steineri]|uniref:Metal-dependent hydrolase n=2 Tax=Adineta steineri TaxID=433720 RepID=A0A818S3B1_9BILA|nr:unnamed protein product [Adineta steineri]CAF3660335.1 unnamed protein product [Adineta steineri]